MLLLGVALIVGQLLEKNRIDWMSEAGAALIIGVVLGLTVNLVNAITPDFENMFKFNVRNPADVCLASIPLPRLCTHTWAELTRGSK